MAEFPGGESLTRPVGDVLPDVSQEEGRRLRRRKPSNFESEIKREPVSKAVARLTEPRFHEVEPAELSPEVEQALELVACGEANSFAAAARAVGIDPEALRRQIKKPAAQAKLLELTRQALVASAPGAAATIRRLSQQAKSEYVQLEASKDVLERAGIRAEDGLGNAAVVNVQINLD